MKKNGFTLIELMVAITLFAIVIGAVSGVFVSGLREQRRALASAELLDQTSYVLEYMSRALRMAKKEIDEGCLLNHGLNYEITPRGGLRFINHLEEDDCQEFFLENNQLMYWKQSTNQTLPLTSENLEIVSLNFRLRGEDQADNLQPRVTISFNVRAGVGDIRPYIIIQTTVSQRNLDILY